jgi:hypothetical protein
MIYKLNKSVVSNEANSVTLTLNDKIICIPMDEANTDYQEYIKWTKASPKNVAEPADE